MASKDSTPPYPSAARISDSPCYPQYTASLKCLEEFSSDKSKCQEHFDMYKECKKKETKMSNNNSDAIPDVNYATAEFLIVGWVLEHADTVVREARLERNRNRSFFS